MDDIKLKEILLIQAEIISRLVVKQLGTTSTPTYLLPEKQELKDLEQELQEKLKAL